MDFSIKYQNSFFSVCHSPRKPFAILSTTKGECVYYLCHFGFLVFFANSHFFPEISEKSCKTDALELTVKIKMKLNFLYIFNGITIIYTVYILFLVSKMLM